MVPSTLMVFLQGEGIREEKKEKAEEAYMYAGLMGCLNTRNKSFVESATLLFEPKLTRKVSSILPALSLPSPSPLPSLSLSLCLSLT